jgi:hypothetical protein
METRRDNDDPAVADLIDSLHQVDPTLKAAPTSPYDGPDLVLQAPGGAKILIEVKAARRPSPATTAALIKRTSPFDGKTHVLVADYLMPEVRRLLKDAGWSWLDRRGHLRLRADSLLLDTEVPPQVSGGPPAAPLSTQGGRDVAMLLVATGQSVGVRQAAQLLHRSPSTVSGALRDLRNVSLVGSSGSPVLPELFWALSAEWVHMYKPVGLRNVPPRTAEPKQLRFGFDDPEHSIGWALRGTLAAAAWGAQLAVSGDYPPDFFVPDERTLRIAEHLFGRTDHDPACTVAVAPNTWIVNNRFDLKSRGIAQLEWPIVHPVVAALDLAQDPRGREALQTFVPPKGWNRAW